jgi:hypothetical protein
MREPSGTCAPLDAVCPSSMYARTHWRWAIDNELRADSFFWSPPSPLTTLPRSFLVALILRNRNLVSCALCNFDGLSTSLPLLSLSVWARMAWHGVYA